MPIATALRTCGGDIKKHAEEEQAAVIYWMIEMYENHGADWKTEAQNWLNQKKADLENNNSSLQRVKEDLGDAELSAS